MIDSKKKVIAGVKAFGSLWTEFPEPIYGLSCLRICIENLKKLHPEKGKRTLKKLNRDKNSDQQQQQQQQQMCKLAIAGGLLDLFRMLGSEEGLKGKIGAEDELKADEEEEKATPVMTHMPVADIGRILAPITISDLAKFTESNLITHNIML
ncbi:hypothetical protein BY996DRAFT_6423293 [Phakopsora pachyrhizi]|nr:hypothetical protein BY996DRAFT_6423293 [Phakopsora pachyrhizi]